MQNMPGFQNGPVPAGFSGGQLEAWDILTLINEDVSKSLIPRPVIKALRTHQKTELQYCTVGLSSESLEQIISDSKQSRKRTGKGQMQLRADIRQGFSIHNKK